MPKPISPTPFNKMPKYIRSSADHLAQFIELNAPTQIVEHAAEILRRRINIIVEQAHERDAVDKLPKSSTLTPETTPDAEEDQTVS